MISLIYVFLAILGLSVLIFFHELGHYWMARREGMRVETFSIGFGKPIYMWERKGVKWQIGWLPFGGFVKIAGQDGDETKNPYEVEDGFFGKGPIARIKVALMGPLVNLILAFIIFVVIWATGGREKNYSEFTHKIGWVDPHSELYAAGLRPGDEIISFNDEPYNSSKDLLYGPMISGGEIHVKASKVDYVTFHKDPLELKVHTYPNPEMIQKGIVTSGIMAPANYIIYNTLPKEKENPLPEGSPLAQSGIQYGDRIVWVDGSPIFSSRELTRILNDDRVLLTIFRKGNRLLMRVPRVPVQELKMDQEFKEELTDWQYEANLNNTKLQKLYMIPYNLTNDCVVENEIKFIDKDNEKGAFPEHPFAFSETQLLPKDKIIAVDGSPVKTSYDLLAKLQKRHVNIIVERNPESIAVIDASKADAAFDKQINWNDISAIAGSIGSGHLVQKAGDYILLNPVTPKLRSEFELTPEKQAWLTAALLEKQKEVESIEDPEKRAQALAMLQSQEKEHLLGLPGVQDRKVQYNPGPVVMFHTVFTEIWRTLAALFTGSLNPKWISGPIGIVQVVHDNWMVGIKEALFWLGAISLNLGILNLLPIPVLDGGTILLALFEWVTGKQLHPKTLERLIVPFAILLIIFFVFLTYQDLSRIFTGFAR